MSLYGSDMASEMPQESSSDIFQCKVCDQVLYAEDTLSIPTERRGWLLYIPHFCCCGKCGWDCNHNHKSMGNCCSSYDHTSSDANNPCN